jgi:excisionase family DNA binding protein
MTSKTKQPREGYEWIGGFREAAAYIGCTERQLRRWVQSGRVGHTRMGAAVRFSKEQLDAFVQDTSVDGAA